MRRVELAMGGVGALVVATLWARAGAPELDRPTAPPACLDVDRAAPEGSGEAGESCTSLRPAPPPPTRREDVVDVIHGTPVPDPYRWLEPSDDPEVQAWSRAQDAHARAWLRDRPEREALRRVLRERIDVTTVSVPVRYGDRLFFARRRAGRDLPEWIVREGDHGDERVLIDPLALDPSGRTSVSRVLPSPDGRRVAYLVHRDGADAATLHLRDVDTGRDLPDRIDGARYASPSWTADGRAFVYTALPVDPSIPPPELPAHATVKEHVVGTPAAEDRVLYGPLGEAATFVGVRLADRGRVEVLTLQRGWSETEILVRPRGTTRWRPLFQGQRALASVSVYDGRYFVHTNAGAPRYRVVEIDPDRPEPAAWREVVPQTDATLEAAPVLGGRLLLQYLRRASGALEIRTLAGEPVAEIPLPGPAAIGSITGSPHEDAAYVSVSAIHRRPSVLKISMHAASPSTWHAPDEAEAASRAPLVLQQVQYPSRDGTPITMFVLHRDDLVLDGQAPTMLTGYGGFGVSITPQYSPIATLWAEAGGVWAVPNLRGGGEYGEGWHEAGRRAHKQNTFDDFIAAAQWLQAEGYTRPPRLAIRGGSNGGLLVGAVSTQRPELFGAVVCAVPLLDMIRFHRFGAGSTWVDEYGSPDDPTQFRWLWGYSPLHKIEAGRGHSYPPLLMLSADHDDRVHPMHARKFVAAMQHAGARALLRVEQGAGHGGSPRLADRIEAELDTLLFVLDAIGG